MKKTRSDPTLLRTKRHVVRDHISGAIPNYAGHVPGARLEDTTFAATFAKSVEASRAARQRASCDAQVMKRTMERGDDAMSTRSRSSRASSTIRAPAIDNRGISYPAAGDTHHSRIPVAGEERAHYHSGMGLTSLAHEKLGHMHSMRGYASAAKGIPGYTGYCPGKVAENVVAEGWSKGGEKGLTAHFQAKAHAPKQWSLMTEGGTMVAAHPNDGLKEVPIWNPSYQDHNQGWSKCEFTGSHIDPAGRLAPRDRQEMFATSQPPVNRMTAAIHGYAGWVPGRVGENVIGERQCKTNAISDQLFKKQCMRITQR